jgi:hypothetical protein
MRDSPIFLTAMIALLGLATLFITGLADSTLYFTLKYYIFYAYKFIWGFFTSLIP